MSEVVLVKKRTAEERIKSGFVHGAISATIGAAIGAGGTLLLGTDEEVNNEILKNAAEWGTRTGVIGAAVSISQPWTSRITEQMSVAEPQVDR